MGGAIVIFIFLMLWVFLIPALLSWLWNITIPDLFGLKNITYWQAFRLVIIAGILTGGGSLIKFTGTF